MKSFIKKIIIFGCPHFLLSFVYSVLSLSFFKRLIFKINNCGSNTYIHPSVQMIGLSNIKVGSNTLISEDCWFNVNFRSNAEMQILIGDNCHIGRRNFFSSGSLISLGCYSFTSIDCHFLGSGHNYSDPYCPYLISGVNNGDSIKVGVNCWLATSVTVFPGVSIGHGSIIGARSVVTKDIPPFSVAVGNPCVVIKRFNPITMSWVSASDFNDDLEGFLPNEDQYLADMIVTKKSIPLSLVASGLDFGSI
jgi:acetyltransferase-like isoleucine patch superfamily enzyme